MDVSKEITFQTTRSGGKGGQNVNKVETAVIAAFHVATSVLLSEAQKATLREKLSHRISASGYLQVRSQTYRTQLDNKEDAIKRINALIKNALQKKKARIATKISKAANEKRIISKKKEGLIKESRKKIDKNYL